MDGGLHQTKRAQLLLDTGGHLQALLIIGLMVDNKEKQKKRDV